MSIGGRIAHRNDTVGSRFFLWRDQNRGIAAPETLGIITVGELPVVFIDTNGRGIGEVAPKGVKIQGKRFAGWEYSKIGRANDFQDRAQKNKQTEKRHRFGMSGISLMEYPKKRVKRNCSIHDEIR